MEQLRISEKNILRNDIKFLETQIKRNTDTIKRLQTMQEHTDFYKKQAEKLKEQIKSDEEKIEEYNKKIEDITTGKYDKELTKTRDDNNIIMKSHIDTSKKKNSDEHEKKKEDKKNLDLDYNTFRKFEGVNDNTVEKEKEKYFKNSESVPDYMKNNLKEMPNNKGYIWKGITFFGSLPKQNDNIILFEKCKGGILKIYEIDDKTCYIYEKEGKKQKKFIKSENRVKLT